MSSWTNFSVIRRDECRENSRSNQTSCKQAAVLYGWLRKSKLQVFQRLGCFEVRNIQENTFEEVIQFYSINMKNNL